MPNNELQELLGARFERYEHPTDESVWTAIEAHLDDEQSDKVGIWFWMFNGTAIALFAGILLSSTFSSEKADRSIATTVVSEQSIESENLSPSNTNEAHTSGRIIDKTAQTATTSETIDSEHVSGSSNQVGKQTSRKWNDEISPSTSETHTSIELDKVDRSPIEISSQGKNFEQDQQDISLLEVRAAQVLDQDLNRSSIPQEFNTKKRFLLKPIPVFVNLQYSSLHRINAPEGVYPDPSNPTAILDQLANNRTFNSNLMVHLQLTPRFTTGLGFGYSNSKYAHSYQAVTNQGVKQVNIRTAQSIYLLPLQAKFNLLQRKRFQLNTGLTWINEFGSTDFSVASKQDQWSTTSSPTELIESNTEGNDSFHQSALEPFVQVAYSFLPRFSAHFDVGYRQYFGTTQLGQNSSERLQYTNTTIGLIYQLR